MSTITLALIILAAILAQVAVVVARMIVRARRDAVAPRPSPRAGRKASDTQPRATPSPEGPGWEGFREFVVQRRVIEDDAGSVCSFHLAPADSLPLPAYRPGQFLTFRLAIPDPAGGEPKSVVRCYSLSDRPRPDHYRVSIKRVPPPPDQPDAPPGRSSGYFHDHVQEGDRLQVRAPSGHFHLMDTPHPIVLIGGGIGITPMLSIANTLLEQGDPREIRLYYGVRNGGEEVMKEHLRALATAHPNFHLHVCYSNPHAGEREGEDYQHAGRIDVALLRATLKLARYQFYICGPPPMMESLVPALEEWGVDSADIHYEAFGPASLARREKSEREVRAVDDQAIAVTFGRSGKTLTWDPTADSLLEFAENNGIAVESGCRAGSCGCCQTALESGAVRYNQEPDAEIAPGHCLLCISTPSADITLAA